MERKSRIPKDLEYLLKIANSKNKKMTQSAWCRYVDIQSGNRNNIIKNFIEIGIMKPAGKNSEENILYKLNRKAMLSYSRQSDFYKWLLTGGKKVFGMYSMEDFDI